MLQVSCLFILTEDIINVQGESYIYEPAGTVSFTITFFCDYDLIIAIKKLKCISKLFFLISAALH